MDDGAWCNNYSLEKCDESAMVTKKHNRRLCFFVVYLCRGGLIIKVVGQGRHDTYLFYVGSVAITVVDTKLPLCCSFNLA